MAIKINIVLHKTIYPSNIGFVARAMGNMGAHQLILISPLCKINSQTQRAAVGCQSFLNNQKTYYTWEDFYQKEKEGLRIGFTARSGKNRSSKEAELLFEEIKNSYQKDDTNPLYQNIYLIFGREDSGLSAEDTEYFHHTSTLKTYGDYTSLNLSQAVLIALHTAQRHLPENVISDTLIESDFSETSKDKIFYPKDIIHEWLEALGFDLSAKKMNALKILNKILLKNEPSPKELKVFESILRQNIRKLESKK